MDIVRLGPACGRILLDFDGALCVLLSGHDGPCDAGEPPPPCPVPDGWRCRRLRGHAGPCAAVEVTSEGQCDAGLPGWIDPYAHQAACQLERGHDGPHRIEWEDM